MAVSTSRCLWDLGVCGLRGGQRGLGRWQSTVAALTPPGIQAPRTSVTKPQLHTTDHLGLWYTVNSEAVKKLFGLYFLPKVFRDNCQTFTETSIMVRQPALTVMDYIKRSNLALSPNKFMLYGRDGVGKTIILAHLTHFLAEDGWLLLHTSWTPRWRRCFKEVGPSPSTPGRYDSPLDAVLWLQHFRSQNADLLKSLELRVQEQYTWSRREVTEVGSLLSALVDLGISRARYASDVALALTTELKAHANQGRCKVGVVLDGVNTFFCPLTRYRREDLTYVEPKDFTLLQAFTHLLDNNWKNGVIIGSIDRLANEGTHRESHLPRYLLREKGWLTLDPFVPIEVTDYSEKELMSVIDYYLDRQWLQSPEAHTELGRLELATLSSYNPLNLANICCSL